MLTLSLIANTVLAGGLALALWRIQIYRERRKQRGLFGSWPVPQVDIDAFDARFATDSLGPSQDTEIRFIANYRVEGGISDLETWVLCNLAKDARRIFEFGTCTGKTTYLLAAKSPAEARITTLTLGPEQQTDYKAEAGDRGDAQRSAMNESVFERLYYEGTPEAAKIEQRYGDSKAFDETPHVGSCDLVFVDGSHARSYVQSDSRKALAMARPGGLVVWHDYRGPRGGGDVFAVLNEMARDLPLVHIKGTSFVVCRKPS